ncbi:MAG: ATP-grasp domain-containing protein [Actinobacteria bacterium]|nr:ATP-grasp domain-containing protein [Actinomycetota bacterium]
MFDTVLVANRGEIAVRVMRTLRALGIRSVAVYSDVDARARHVAEADVAIRLGPAPATASYLSIERVLAAATQVGADAIHPGYGFLAENAGFAAACARSGVVFVGPPVPAIEVMGDKIRAKKAAVAAGVPVLPGRAELGMSDEQIAEAVREVGVPVLLKPSAGGGGKGMRLVRDGRGLAELIAAARREAVAAFGDGALLVERYVEAPRHIEVQILADTHGTVVHLGERECSLQRRHQKIIEEAPSPLLDTAGRDRIGAAAVRVARSVGYTGAGTVEFLVPGDRPEEFFFLEMNTRLQVEHPVTEAVTGVDLVEWQLRVAAGERLGVGVAPVTLTGHAIEARVYAEDPARGFLPTGGSVLALAEPALPHVRVDSGLRVGDTVGSAYDPMLAKVTAWGPDRETARRRLDRALAAMAVLGVTTNLGFLRALLADPDVVAGRLDTGLVERRLAEPGRAGLADAEVPADVLVAAALERLLALTPTGPVVDPWQLPGGWRVGEPVWTTWQLQAPGSDPVPVGLRGPSSAAEARVGGGPSTPASARFDGATLEVSHGGQVARYVVARDGAVLWLGHAGRAWALTEADQLTGAGTGAGAGSGAGGAVRSPMPGTVLAVSVAEGERVGAGQPLLIVEAMKMEHTVTAPVAGTVSALHARTGQQVRVDELLAMVTAGEQP